MGHCLNNMLNDPATYPDHLQIDFQAEYFHVLHPGNIYKLSKLQLLDLSHYVPVLPGNDF
jgi:hypothetical protein